MERKNDNMLVSFDDIQEDYCWDACLHALETEYTLSLKSACRLLKCSRSWVQKYVRPHVHYVFLSRGIIDGKRKRRAPDYARIASVRLKKKFTESTWLNRSEFEALIRKNMTWSRQTIAVPIELFMDDDNFQEKYFQIMEALNSAYQSEKISFYEIDKLKNECEVLIQNSLSKTGKVYYLAQANKYRRSETPAVVCDPLVEFELKDLQAVHDLKNYGDTDEEIYRDLFEKGCYRLELQLSDAEGNVSKKIYYLDRTKQEEKIWQRVGIDRSVKLVPMQFGKFVEMANTLSLPIS